jgi:hypothetical protein
MLRAAVVDPQLAFELSPIAGRANLADMIWKLLLTAAVIFGAYLVIRARIQRAKEAQGLVAPRPPLIPPGLIRPIAYILLAFMLVGSATYLARDLGRDRQTIRVEVVNANTGAVTEYDARRGSVEGRRFVTSDGREVRLADVERLVIDESR